MVREKEKRKDDKTSRLFGGQLQSAVLQFGNDSDKRENSKRKGKENKRKSDH